MNFVQHFCSIKNGVVRANGKKIFSSTLPLPEFAEQLYSFLKVNYPKFYKMDHLSKLGFLATEIVMSNKKLDVTPYDVSVVLSNASSSLDTDINYFESSKKAASPALFVYTLPNIVNGEISIRHGFKGESSFFVTPQFDAGLLCTYCDELLKEKSKLCIAGWVEVMEAKYDVFLYVVGKTQSQWNHTPQIINSLYSA